ncbi:MAG: ATP-binding protein [Caldilineaceae bacterium]
MSWMVPSVVAALTTSAVLAFVYSYLYVQERDHHLKLWAWSWSLYTVRFVFDLLILNLTADAPWLVGQQAATLASALLLYAGTMHFLGWRILRIWIWIGVGCFVWVLVAMLAQFSVSVVSLPVFMLAGFLYVRTGWVLLRQGKGDIGSQITGWTLIAWGIHKWDYPLLRPVLWFAPWGFLIGAVFSQIVAVGTLILYFRQIKDELADSERRFRRLAENAQDMIYRFRYQPAPGYEYVSPSAIRLTGYSPEDFYDDPMLGVRLVHPDDHRYLDPPITDAVGGAGPLLIRWLHKDGRVLWIEQRNVIIYDDDGQMLALEGIARDVTKRVKNEMQIRQQAAREEAINQIVLAAAQANDLPSFFDGALSQILSGLNLDIGACWIGGAFASSGVERDSVNELIAYMIDEGFDVAEPIVVNDVTSESLLPQTVSGWFLQQDIHACLLVSVISDGESIGGIGVANHSARVWTEHEISLLQTVGNQLGTVAMRLHLLEQLQTVTHRLQQVMDAVPDGVCLLDATQRIVLANRSAATYLALLSGVGVGDVVQSLAQQPIVEFLQPPGLAPWHEIEAAGRVFTVRSQPIAAEFVDDGWLLVINDVTHEREIQERAQQQERLAAVGQLAAGIAHDFNNIMGAIVIYSQLMKNTLDLSGKNRERLEVIHQQAQYAAELVRQLLDFSRTSVLERHTLNAIPFCKDLVKLLERILPETIEIVFTAARPDYQVTLDPARFQVIVNLAVATRDAMPEGGRLTIHAVPFSATGSDPTTGAPGAGDWIQIRIEDTGCGIPQHFVPRLFEPFFTTKDKGKGTGLGLAQVYGIVKQHGGEIRVESVVNKGSCFTIYLPAWREYDQSPQMDTASSLSAGRGESILVVEDNEAARVALIDTLEMLLGYRTFAAPTVGKRWIAGNGIRTKIAAGHQRCGDAQDGRRRISAPIAQTRHHPARDPDDRPRLKRGSSGSGKGQQHCRPHETGEFGAPVFGGGEGDCGGRDA